MSKGKKRILFDVFDNVQPTTSARSRGVTRKTPKAEPPAPRPNSDGTLRITQQLAITFAVVGLVFLGLAYWFGYIHGSGSDGTSSSGGRNKSLERNQTIDRADLGRHFAVQAAMANCIPETFNAYRNEYLAYVTTLKDQGYEYVDLRFYATDPTEPDAGQMILWVGKASRLNSLEKLALELQDIPVGGEYPFRYAVPELFRGSSGH